MSHVKPRNIAWHDATGTYFHALKWEPASRPKAVLAVVHGLGEHIGRYAALADDLTHLGYAATAVDLRGHGRSAGPRGHTPSYDALMDDMVNFMGQVRKRFADLPIFLFGHSLGGNIVLNFVLRRRPAIQGAIVSAPWLRLAFQPPAWKLALARLVDPIMPRYSQNNELDIEGLSRDASVVEKYRRDPLVHDRISARLYLAAHDAGLWALDHAGDFPVPVLVMQGSDDRLISIQASREFARRAGRKATFHAWDGLYHEIHNEADRPLVIRYMTNWMQSILHATPARRPRAGQKH